MSTLSSFILQIKPSCSLVAFRHSSEGTVTEEAPPVHSFLLRSFGSHKIHTSNFIHWMCCLTQTNCGVNAPLQSKFNGNNLSYLVCCKKKKILFCKSYIIFFFCKSFIDFSCFHRKVYSLLTKCLADMQNSFADKWKWTVKIKAESCKKLFILLIRVQSLFL